MALAAPAATTPPPSCASGAMPQGVDVSAFQGAVNWTQVAGNGCKFAFIKATEGNYYSATIAPSGVQPNTYYPSNVKGAKAASRYVSSYHFANPHVSSGINQADFFLGNSIHTADGQTLPPTLDIEPDPYSTDPCYGLTQSQMVSWISAFNGEVQRVTGQVPIIYTTANWWKTCTNNSTAFNSSQLWIASPGASSPTLPTAWPNSNWMFWQYTSSGSVPGITGNVDLDYFKNSRVDLIDPGTQRDAPGTTVSPLQVNSLNAAAGQSLSFDTTNTGLPAGLSISSTGQITGTISAPPGAYNVKVTATNPSSSTTAPGSVNFLWEVPGTITVTPPPSQSTAIGSSADLQVHATDTAAKYTPTFTATGLPPGTSITSSGRIIGWPTAAGTYNVTVTATDALQASGSTTFSWTVSNAPNQGPAGQVWLQNGGKCLDDPGGRTANSTRVQIWTCLGNTNQRWTVVQDGTLRAHGTSSCLAEAGTGNGAAVVLDACNGSSAQRWQVGTNAELVNTASGRCLDDTGARTANGTFLQIWACGGGTNQHWIPAAAPVMSGIPGKCVDDTGFSTANGTRLQIWACTGASNQRWTVEPDGTIRVSGKCLDIVGYGTTSGSSLDLWTCTGASNQHWKIVPEGPFGSEVVNPVSGKCLADAGDATANGSKLTIQNCQAQDPGTIWHVL
jgi:GH25 family lysozyme M1 (1,4-beta-N-acetylmuramidase)